jgi:hypothetical protein
MDTSGISRLGFESWASNIMVNAIEDYVVPCGAGGEGNVSHTGKDFSMHMDWDRDNINCSVRAWTESNGWQEYSHSIKRKASPPPCGAVGDGD